MGIYFLCTLILTLFENFMISASNLSKSVQSPGGTLNILSDINLSIMESESLAIVGPSGSGKSTLLGILAGLDTPTSGDVVINNKNIVSMSEEERAKYRSKYVGFVFQSFHLLPGLTAIENVSLPLEIKDVPNTASLASDYLEMVGLKNRARHYPQQLSGGEQQRVAVARAFACQPKILFADEPTGNLDQKTGAKLSNLLFELNKSQKTTLILVTHDMRLASSCDKTLNLSDGKAVPNK